MKKYFLFLAVAAALSLTGCNNSDNNKDYKAEAQELSKQLDEKVETQDTAGIIAADEAIRKAEADIIASGDTAALAQFREAMKDARVRNATSVTLTKIHNGMDKDKAVKQLMQDALVGNLNISDVTRTLDAVLQAEQKAENK